MRAGDIVTGPGDVAAAAGRWGARVTGLAGPRSPVKG